MQTHSLQPNLIVCLKMALRSFATSALASLGLRPAAMSSHEALVAGAGTIAARAYATGTSLH
jgi:hypothetical protein